MSNEYLFQSLFYWKFYFNQNVPNHQTVVLTVSILILLEVLLQPIDNESFIVQNFVSILILLEVLLQPLDADQLLSMHIKSFNPYFTGSSTSTKMEKLKLCQKIYCFNPYFTGSSTSTLHYYFFVFSFHKFQSLFYWKFYFNTSGYQD